MIEITKQEADFLKDNVQEVKISMVGRQKKANRKKYFAEETPTVFTFLKEYNDMHVVKKAYK